MYLQKWEDSVKQREGFTLSEKKKMLLSDETLEGLRLTGEDLFFKLKFSFTVQSFLELSQKLLSVPWVEHLLSEKFCQDPLESFFGHQRAYNDNPSVQHFLDNIRVHKSAALEPVRRNCRKRRHNIIMVDNNPLPDKINDLN